MTHDNDERLAAWLADGPAHGPAGGLESAIARTRSGGQRPGWLVAATGGTIAQSPAGGQLRFALVGVALLVTLVAGALIAGGLLPKPDPAPSPAVIASPDASFPPSPQVEQDQIVFTRWRRVLSGEEDCTSEVSCYRSSIFTSNQDGSGERELFPGPRSELLAMPRNGLGLLFRQMQPNGDFVTLITDGHGSEPRVLNTCGGVPCEDWGHTFKPDGSELAFVRPGDNGETVIAIMYLNSGVVEELESTRVANPDLGDPCHTNCGAGDNGAPSWSPRGTHLVFTRWNIGIPDQPPQHGEFLDTGLFIVDVDGSNFHQLNLPAELFPVDPRWSRDGSLIAFTSSVNSLTDPGVIDNQQQRNDIYVVRPDGTGLERLTTDTLGPIGTTEPVEYGARFPTWTKDGRIVFVRNAAQVEDPPAWQVWVMDSEGANQTQLDPSDAAALTAVGCVSCPYPSMDPTISYPTIAFWVPAAP